MPTFEDPKLGKVTIRRSALSSRVRMSIAPNGTIRVSAPRHIPLFMIKRVVSQSRTDLQLMIDSQRPTLDYVDGSPIGKSHSLSVRPAATLAVAREGLRVIVSLPSDTTLADNDVQVALREVIIAALRREAKGYLPKRLAFLAEKYDFSYHHVRFSHASSRWGSCSSTGTISLNIALMKLPFELIDYVLIHELAHTKEMNHSASFWAIVERYDPSYQLHRARLKSENPII